MSFAPEIEVEFYYSLRTDISKIYILGNNVEQTVILDKITVKRDGETFSEYHFEYAFDNHAKVGNDFSKLVEIKYSNSESEEVNSTLIQWNSIAPNDEFDELQLDNSNFSSYGSYNNRVIYADINGDGIDDILELRHSLSAPVSCNTTTYERHLYEIWAHIKDPNGNGFNSNIIKNQFTSHYSKGSCDRTAYCEIFPGDFNGDGLLDFLYVRASPSNDNEFFVVIYTNDPNNPGNFIHHLTEQIDNHLPYGYSSDDKKWCPWGWNFSNTLAPNQEPLRVVVGDFDGDGITDFSYAGDVIPTSTPCNAYNHNLFIKYLNQTGIDQTVVFPFGVDGPVDSISLADFTGDGKPEFLVVGKLDSEILSFDSRTTYNTIYSSGFPTSYHYVDFGDFNGDGKQDLIVRNDVLNEYEIHLFNGKDFSQLPTIPGLSGFSGINPNEAGSRMTLRIADVDNDGRDDLLFIYQLDSGVDGPGFNGRLSVFYNKVNGWRSTQGMTSLIKLRTCGQIPFTTSCAVPQHFTKFADFSGDGNYGLYSFPFDHYLKFRPDIHNSNVHQILDGFNTLTTFEFKPLSSPLVYENSSNYTYPNPSLTIPMYVTASVVQTGKFGTILIDQSFFYKTLRYNKKGLGLLGFEEEVSENKIGKTKSTSFAHFPPISMSLKDSRPLLSWKEEVEVEDDNGGWQLISRVETDYNQNLFQQFAGKFNFLIRTVETRYFDFISETSSKNEITYDVNNNVTISEERIYDNTTLNGSPFFEAATNYNNYVLNGSWIPWQPEEVITTQQRSGEDPVSSLKNYEYHPNGNLFKLTKNPFTEAEVIKEYIYDQYGHVTIKKVFPQSMDTRETVFTYTACNRFVESATNPANWVETFQYDLLLGVKTQQTDVNGLVTMYEYDGFGSLVKTFHPDGNTSEQEIVWNIGFGPSSYLFAVRSFGSVELPTVEFFDDAQRVIRQSNMNSMGNYINLNKSYNSKGLNNQVSLPFESGQTPQWNTKQFDYLGRVTQTIGQNSTVNYSYNGRETTVENITLNQTSSTLTDPLGLVVEANDEGGTIEYEYNSFGKAKTVTGPSNDPITSVYDDFGRQIELNDPAAGTIVYNYDALGQLIRQNDVEGNLFDMEYDILGRLTKKSGPDGDFEFMFDGQFFGLMDEAISPDNVTNNYIYDDPFGRITSRNEMIDGQDFNFAYTYNADGLLDTYMYPNGFIVKYEYNQFNVLSDIKRADNDEIIWAFGDENQFGQITQYYLGSNQEQWNRAYDATTGLPTTWTNQQGNWNMTYTFDLESTNLQNRNNVTHATSDVFQYDQVNRLTEIYSTNASSVMNNIEINYSVSGNITSKSDIGTYVNDNAGRTFSVNDPSELVSSNFQMIEYTEFNKIKMISEGDYDAFFLYGPDEQRRHMKIQEGGADYIERFYVGDFEREYANGEWRDICYIPLPSGDLALFIDPQSGTGEIYFAYQDYQGSILAIADDNGSILEEYSYDAWGNRRDVTTLENYYSPGGGQGIWQGFFHRGYTGHEHLECFGLINMNGRFYDPLLGRMLSPDKYVQAPGFSQNFNRYSYAWNNPLTYSDPSGDIILPIIIGATIGAYIGGTVANDGNYNPFKWDYNSGKTWGYMLGGAMVGGLSGYVGGVIAAAEIPMANTLGIMGASFTNSIGTYAYSGGQTDISISFGVGSYNFSNNKLGGIWNWKTNSSIENIGYSFGVLANLSDAISLFSGGGQNVDVNSASAKDEWWGHSSITDNSGRKLVSVGPEIPIEKSKSLTQLWKNSIVDADVDYATYFGKKGTWSVRLNNVSTSALNNYTSGITRWDLLFNSCVGHTTMALMRAGVPTIYAFHPHMLNLQLAIRQIGIYASPYLYQIP
ncbi:MAG: VCBS repeat-containing protein [Cryomorphaceae bacterium]|nr:VCBS repeat-containing protein [Cryomorphaceae bacterium]